ncbi:MAG: hypothetical protein WCF49_07925, partial [Xanthobacteraceae bacterium]
MSERGPIEALDRREQVEQRQELPLDEVIVAEEMLKAWKLKSQFSRSDDLIFPNREGQHLGHDNFIKRQFLPLFDLLPT